MAFDYYYGAQADQFNFIKIPKLMITDPLFEGLSVNAILLYGVLLDRMNLSMKNRWFDEENRVYIIYQVAEIMEDFKFSKKTAVKYLNELEDFGLVEKKRRGLGLPSLLYVKSFIVDRDYSKEVDEEKEPDIGETNDTNEQENYGTSRGVETDTSRSVEMGTSRGVTSYTSRGVETVTSRSVEKEPQEVTESAPLNNKTNINNTNKNNTNVNNTNINNTNISSNHIKLTMSDEMRSEMMLHKRQAYENLIKDNISYANLMHDNVAEREEIDNLVDIMVEAVVSDKEYQIIGGEKVPTELIKSRFCKFNNSHMLYVLDSLRHNSTEVRNIKKYLLATLYNAPATMDSYYQALVRHDMPEFTLRTTFNN